MVRLYYPAARSTRVVQEPLTFQHHHRLVRLLLLQEWSELERLQPQLPSR